MGERVCRILAAAALAALASCSLNPKPQPPEPPPPEPQCAEGQTHSCWHRPPGNDWLYACYAPNLPGGVLNVAGGPAQCPGGQPDPPPVGDVPPKGVPQGPERLLRSNGTSNFTDNTGKRVDPFMAVPCCMGWEKVPNQLWPMASELFIDETAKYGANAYHFRIGPWFGDETAESEWTGIGGAYLPDGSWNPAFWAKTRALVWHAYQKGALVEVVAIDSWWLKNATGKDVQSGKMVPWPDSDVRAYGVAMTQVQEALVRKTVEELGCFGNVFWATGNEEDLIPRMTGEYLNSIVTITRDEERRSGCGFVHAFGTGSHKGGIAADYQITHERSPVTGPCNGRLCVNNEHNPEFSPEEEASLFAQARSAGQTWAAWRAGAEDPEWEKRLQLLSEIVKGQAPPVGCYAPAQEPDELWQTLGAGPGDRTDEIRQGQANLGSLCKEPKHHSNGDAAIEALAAEMRRLGYCASKHSDSVTIQSENDPKVWEEYHAVAPYDTGCWSQRPQDYPHNRHRYLGGTPTPPPACPIPVPLVDEVLCKIHQPNQGLWDCTPKSGGRPILPEGDPNREACEKKAMGGDYPTYKLGNAPTTLTLSTVENPMQFRIQGSGSGTVTCVVPASNGKNICKGGDTSIEQGVPVSR